MTDVYEYLRELHRRYPAFDPSTWKAPTDLTGVTLKDKDGTLYRNVQWNRPTKTWVYEMKLTPNDRWSGPYHGRRFNELLTMERI